MNDTYCDGHGAAHVTVNRIYQLLATVCQQLCLALRGFSFETASAHHMQSIKYRWCDRSRYLSRRRRFPTSTPQRPQLKAFHHSFVILPLSFLVALEGSALFSYLALWDEIFLRGFHLKCSVMRLPDSIPINTLLAGPDLFHTGKTSLFSRHHSVSVPQNAQECV